MLLVDAGNTNIAFAQIKNGTLKKPSLLPTGNATKKIISKELKPYLKDKILLVSVVPRITEIFKKIHSDIFVVGEDFFVPINCHYRKKQIGQDRLVVAYAALCLYPETRIVIDFGTAITFDFVSKKEGYLGGIILPGLGSTLRVLSSCALLPRSIKFSSEKKLSLNESFIPRNTQESIEIGIKMGFSHMLNSLVKGYKKKLKIPPSSKVIITGGDAKSISTFLKFPYALQENLVIKGLFLLSRNI